MYLFVTPTGGKLWRGKYRVNGREKTLSLGPYPKGGLAEAREKWQDARKLDDPSAAKQAEKQSSDSTTPTFLAVASSLAVATSGTDCSSTPPQPRLIGSGGDRSALGRWAFGAMILLRLLIVDLTRIQQPGFPGGP